MEEDKTTVGANINQVLENIKNACKKSGRNPEDVTLIAVSKTKPLPMLQEIMDKYPNLPSDIRWHMIGHLQRNKVKYIIDKVALIHSVDSLRLANEISNQAQKKQVDVDILIEVNIAGEESKFGTSREEVFQLVEEIAKLPNIFIKGLMTIAPFVANPEDNRKYFRQIRELSVDIMNKNIDNVTMSVLSMGMTGDYMVAIEEGATMVRVGTGIFGERTYTNTQ